MPSLRNPKILKAYPRPKTQTSNKNDSIPTRDKKEKEIFYSSLSSQDTDKGILCLVRLSFFSVCRQEIWNSENLNNTTVLFLPIIVKVASSHKISQNSDHQTLFGGSDGSSQASGELEWILHHKWVRFRRASTWIGWMKQPQELCSVSGKEYPSPP